MLLMLIKNLQNNNIKNFFQILFKRIIDNTIIIHSVLT